MGVNKIANQQLKNIQKNAQPTKASNFLAAMVLLCGVTFVVLLILFFTGTVPGWTLLIPFVSLLVSFIGAIVATMLTLTKKGLLNPKEIKEEEKRMMDKKLKDSGVLNNHKKRESNDFNYKNK